MAESNRVESENYMKLCVSPDAASAAQAAASFIAEEARSAITARGRFILALSGGRTPGAMLRALARESLFWPSVHIVQVDERVAPPGHPDRNLGLLNANLLTSAPVLPERVYPMPVESSDLESAAVQYSHTLRRVAGTPPVLDLIQLGLGGDGHTASLVPLDSVLDVVDRDVAITGTYQGRRRMTLTYPVVNRARRILWLVTGSDKAPMLSRLRAGDPSIPAARVRQEDAMVFADFEAVAQQPRSP